MPEISTMRAAAEAALDKGFSIFPGKPVSKLPATEHGFKDASAKPAQIETWWTKIPDANICIATGESNLIVLDFDNGKVPDGFDLPPTYTVKTARGLHLYYWGLCRTTAMYDSDGNHIGEVKSAGGYILGAGSVHPDGPVYTVISDADIVDAPKEQIEKLARKPTSVLASPSITGDKIPRGRHDNELHRIAGKLRHDGLEEEAIYNALVEVCEKRFENYGSDYLEMCRKHAHNICEKPVGPDTTVLIGGVLAGEAVAGNGKTVSEILAAALKDEQDPLEFLVSAPSQEFAELLRRSKLAQSAPSWLSQNAECPHTMTACDDDWLVERMIRRRGLALLAAKQGSFKSILALFLARALMESNTKSAVEFLGRKVTTQFGDRDNRPLQIYFIDLDSPKNLTRKNCIRVGIDERSNHGTFKIFGAYMDNPIVTLDDPRLIEAAKRERAFFIVDTLSKVFESLDENNPTDANTILSKGTRLAYASEGVLILHHDSKLGKEGYRGATPIVAVPDMSFTLGREKGTNVAVLEDIRFKDVESYRIKFEVSFGGAKGLVIDSHYKYKVLFDSSSQTDRNIASVERQHQAMQRSVKDQELIDKAKTIIEDAAATGKPAPSQNSLAKQLGIKGNQIKERVLCASTNEDLRPWRMARTDRGWLAFFPLSSDVKSETPPIAVEDAQETSLETEEA
jgi:hypothetical protein